MIKMIVTDLDRTLLRDDKTISDYTLTVLDQCRRRGILLAFATARSGSASARFIKAVEPDFFIGYGGAYAEAYTPAGKQKLCRFELSEELSKEILHACLNMPEIQFVYAADEVIKITNDFHYVSEASGYQYTDFADLPSSPFLKITFITESQEAAKALSERFPMCDLYRYSGEDMYKLADRNALKWNALHEVIKLYGMDKAEIAVFGDDLNDLDMIKNCGYGVAVQNAVVEVKEAARFLCRTNQEDGVARWLAEHILHGVLE